MNNREATGWIAITGRAGTGKTTLLKYISHRWGLREALWNNRFDFVFRVKLNLVGQENFWHGCQSTGGIENLSWLISKSLPEIRKFNPQKILQILEMYPLDILLLLDGFDEVQNLYGNNALLTALINAALDFPNGILTSRPDAIPLSFHSKFRLHYENLGLTQDNVKQYVKCYFEHCPSKAKELLTTLEANPKMMGLAQIPVHISAICLTWDEEQFPLNTMTQLYQRVIFWLATRYINPVKLPEKDLMDRCDQEFYLLSRLSFDGFVNNSIQTLDHQLLVKHVNQESLTKLKQFGMLRQASLPVKRGEFAPHYFIHLMYQEYFAALYIADQLSQQDTTDNDISNEILRRQTIHKLVFFISEKRHNPAYTVVWQFLVGITATSNNKYTRAAAFVWDALLEIPSTLLSHNLIIGYHPSISHVHHYQSLLREALLTSHDSLVLLPEILEKFKQTFRHLTLWEQACYSKRLLLQFDETQEINSKELNQHYLQRQKQYKCDRNVLSLEDSTPLLEHIIFQTERASKQCIRWNLTLKYPFDYQAVSPFEIYPP